MDIIPPPQSSVPPTEPVRQTEVTETPPESTPLTPATPEGAAPVARRPLKLIIVAIVLFFIALAATFAVLTSLHPTTKPSASTSTAPSTIPQAAKVDTATSLSSILTDGTSSETAQTTSTDSSYATDINSTSTNVGDSTDANSY